MPIDYEAVLKLGLPTCLVITYVYWSWRRERAMAKRILNLEKRAINLLEKTVTGNTRAFEQNTIAVRQLADQARTNTKILEIVFRENQNRRQRNA